MDKIYYDISFLLLTRIRWTRLLGSVLVTRHSSHPTPTPRGRGSLSPRDPDAPLLRCDFSSPQDPNAAGLLSRSPPLSAILHHRVAHPSISPEAAAGAGQRRTRWRHAGTSPGPGGPPPSPLTRPRSAAASAHPEGPRRHPHNPDAHGLRLR